MLADFTGPTHKSQRSACVKGHVLRVKRVTARTDPARSYNGEGRMGKRESKDDQNVPSTEKARVVAKASALTTVLPPARVVDAGTLSLAK